MRLAACDLGDLPIASVPLVVGVEPADAFRSGSSAASTRASGIAIRSPIRNRRSAIRNQRSAIRNPQSAIDDEASHRVSARARADRAGAGHARPARSRRRHACSAWPSTRRPRRIGGSRSATWPRRFPPRPACGARARSPARAFTHFGRLTFELLRFATLSPRQMLARVEFDGEERARARLRAGQGRAVRHRPFRLLGAAGDGARAADPADHASSRARSTTRTSTGCSSASASAPATRSSIGAKRSGA